MPSNHTPQSSLPGHSAALGIEKTLRMELPLFEPDLEQSGVLTKSVSDAMKSFLESDGNDDVASSFFLVKLQASQALPQGSPVKATAVRAKPTAHANVVDTRSQIPCSPLLPKQKTTAQVNARASHPPPQSSVSHACPPTQASLPLLAPAYVRPHNEADDDPQHTNEALDRYVLDWCKHVAQHEGQRDQCL